MTVLSKIVARKTERLLQAKSAVPLAELKARARDLDATRDFRKAVTRTGEALKLIAEVKRASPSKGAIREPFDLEAIAEIYEEKPVSAISVLTEEDFFKGHLSYLARVRERTHKPLLRKDFLFEAYHIYETRVNSADAVLLIASILERGQAEELLHLARELGLAVLFEVHHELELEVALRVGADIVGINNRDLGTLRIDRSTTQRLRSAIPPGVVVVSESGIQTRDDVLALGRAGVDALLVGTALMSSQDIGVRIEELLGTGEVRQ